jgi:serine/threonine protein kinase
MLFCPFCRIALGPTQPVCPRDGHAGVEAPAPEIPADLARRFTVIDVFARGRTGTSYLVDEPETGRRGLLKLLHLEVASALSDRQRIARELAKQTSLDEPSLVLPMASGETNGVSWLFREWVEGVSVRIRLSRSGPPPLAETVHIGASLARALDALHRGGLLHRDVKSGHVLLVPQDGGHPAVRLIDAGLAAKLDSAKELPVYGTAAYVCPEQTQGKLVSFRSDLYALGAFLFEMLTGAPPFFGATDDETLAMHASAPVPELPASVPRELAALVTSLLSKEPKNRPFSAQQVARTLDAGFAPSPPVAAAAPPTPSPTPSAPPPVPASAASPPPRTPKATLLGIPATDTSSPRVSAPPPPPPPRTSAAPPVPSSPPAPAGRATSMQPPLPPPPPPTNANRKATILGLPSVVAAVAAESSPAIELSSELDSGAFQSLATSDYGPEKSVAISEPTPDAGVSIDDFDEKPTAIQPSLLDLEAAPAAPGDLATDPGIAAALESVDEAPASPFAPTVAAFPATPASSFGPPPKMPERPTFSHPPEAPKRSSAAPIAIFLVLGLGAVGVFAMLRNGSDRAVSPSPSANIAAATPAQAAEPIGEPQPAPEPAPSKPVAPAEAAGPSPVAAAPVREPPSTPPPAAAVSPTPAAPRTAEAPSRTVSPASPSPSRTAQAPAAASRTRAPSTPAAAPAVPAANPAILLRDEARAHYAARRYREAAAAYERLVAISPNDAGVFAGLGRARLELSDGPGAIAAYRRATQLAPNNAGFFVGLGRAHFVSGNRGASETALRQAITLDPNNAAAREGLAAIGAR